MLVKNLTTGILKLRKGNYKKELLPMQINVVDEFKMPAEYIKRVYGSYVQIMADDKKAEVEDANLPDQTTGDMETQEDNGTLQATDNAPSEEEKGEADDNKGGVADTNSEDTNNDNSAPDEDGVEAGEEGKEDAEGEKSEAGKEADTKDADKTTEDKPAKKKGGRGRKQK